MSISPQQFHEFTERVVPVLDRRGCLVGFAPAARVLRRRRSLRRRVWRALQRYSGDLGLGGGCLLGFAVGAGAAVPVGAATGLADPAATTWRMACGAVGALVVLVFWRALARALDDLFGGR